MLLPAAPSAVLQPSRRSQLADAFPAALTRLTSYYVREILSHVLLMEPKWPSTLTARFFFFSSPKRRGRTLGALAFHFGLRPRDN